MMMKKGIAMDNLYDAIIVGGGPAGLTAAIYLARARYRVLVVEKDHFGGQITITNEVVNFPGVERASGAALTETMRRQALSFGAEFLLADVESLSAEGDVKVVKTSRGELRAFGVLLATGARPRTVGFKGESEFRGRGVAYCATCDGEFFTGKEVFVVGGGFAAAEESVFLTKYAKHVTILIRQDDFTCAQSVAAAARGHEKISVLTNTQVDEVSGDSALRSVSWHNRITGEKGGFTAPEGESFGLFVFAGYVPATELLRGLVELDEQGYVITDRTMRTSVEGLYAAGDVCVKPLRQVVTAVGDGALAATELERHAAAMQKKTGLTPRRPSAGSAHNPQKEDRASDDVFDADTTAQLKALFSKMAAPLTLELHLNDSALSRELQGYMEKLAGLTDKLSLSKKEGQGEDLPCVRVNRADGSWSGLAFHGVPGGHEFTSFVLGLYNTAGPGQSLDDETKAAIGAIASPVNLRILVSLSCTMCPELVTAAQRLAADNPLVTAEVYDLNHFPGLQKRYNVMSVPCLVVNDSQVSFGKKNIRQILEIISKALQS